MRKQPQKQFVQFRQSLRLREFRIDDAVGSQGGILNGAKSVVDLFKNDGIAKMLIQIGADADDGIINDVICVPKGHSALHTGEAVAHQAKHFFLIAKMYLQIRG